MNGSNKMPLTRVYAICFAAMVVGATISPTISVLIGMGVDSAVIAFYRLLFISILLIPITFSQKKHRAALKTAHRGMWITILGYSACQTMGLMFWAESINAGGTSFLVSTLGNISTIFVVVFAYIFLNEKTSKRGLLGIGTCLLGVMTVGFGSISQGFGGMLPIIFISLSSLFNAGNSIFGRAARKSLDLLPLIAFGYSLSCVLTGFVALARGADFSLTPKSLLLLVFLGCFSTLISHSTPVWALKYIRPASSSVINLASPFLTAALAFFLLGEVPKPLTYLGAAIMVAGLAFYVITEQQENIKIKKMEEIKND